MGFDRMGPRVRRDSPSGRPGCRDGHPTEIDREAGGLYQSAYVWLENTHPTPKAVMVAVETSDAPKEGFLNVLRDNLVTS